MFVLIGAKPRETRLGWVAEYCPIDSHVHAFELIEVRQVFHLYGIPIGRGSLGGHRVRAEGCLFTSRVELTKHAQVADSKAPVDQLIATANPDVHGGQNDLGSAKGRSVERAQAIESTVFTLAQGYERIRGKGGFDGRAVGALAVTAGMVGLTLFAFNNKWTLLGYALMWGTVASFAASIVFAYLSGRRTLRRDLLPVAQRSLFRLNPPTADIQDALDRVSLAGLALPKRVAAVDLMPIRSES